MELAGFYFDFEPVCFRNLNQTLRRIAWTHLFYFGAGPMAITEAENDEVGMAPTFFVLSSRLIEYMGNGAVTAALPPAPMYARLPSGVINISR